ncbi:MAG: hypothetical protein IKV50_05310 [Clostridia bacterium]|nr:hypothetical protein [Clostridia bacterium]
MKNFIKRVLPLLLCVLAAVLVTGCSAEPTPYEKNDAEGYTVSVRYDANGGTFTTNSSVIVDAFNPADLQKDGEGMAQIALLSPDDPLRGNDAFAASRPGYFLAGWYAVRNEVTDGEGNVTYTYGDRWEFSSDLLSVDTKATHSSQTPVLTLYAAWIPRFEIQFCDKATGEVLETLDFDPTTESVSAPAWNTETGTLEMYKFPSRKGYTFQNAYYDADCTRVLDSETVNHPGVVDYETGTAADPVLKLYVEYREGEWYQIYTAEQLVDNASLDGHYEICADLDFTDEIWPTVFMYGNFSGEIKGNGHTIKNVTFAQTNNSKANAGLFGQLTEKASLTDLIFENVTFTIQSGTRVAGTNYGLLAGTISGDATLQSVQILSSALQIDSACYFGVEDYSIGLLCGMGSDVIPDAEITCTVVGDNPDRITLTVDGKRVLLTFAE